MTDRQIEHELTGYPSIDKPWLTKNLVLLEQPTLMKNGNQNAKVLIYWEKE